MKQNFSLENSDLSAMINGGGGGDALFDRPFLRTSTERRIRHYFENTGWVTFACKCLNHTKVRNNLVHNKTNEKLENIAHGYKVAAKEAEFKR